MQQVDSAPPKEHEVSQPLPHKMTIVINARAGGSGTAQAVPLFIESTCIAINIFIATIDINLLSLINVCQH